MVQRADGRDVTKGPLPTPPRPSGDEEKPLPQHPDTPETPPLTNDGSPCDVPRIRLGKYGRVLKGPTRQDESKANPLAGLELGRVGSTALSPPAPPADARSGQEKDEEKRVTLADLLLTPENTPLEQHSATAKADPPQRGAAESHSWASAPSGTGRVLSSTITTVSSSSSSSSSSSPFTPEEAAPRRPRPSEKKGDEEYEILGREKEEELLRQRELEILAVKAREEEMERERAREAERERAEREREREHERELERERQRELEQEQEREREWEREQEQEREQERERERRLERQREQQAAEEEERELEREMERRRQMEDELRRLEDLQRQRAQQQQIQQQQQQQQQQPDSACTSSRAPRPDHRRVTVTEPDKTTSHSVRAALSTAPFHLNDDEYRMLLQWAHSDSLEVVYRSSVDGFASATFLRRCCGLPGPWIYIAATAEGFIVGGYQSAPWDTAPAHHVRDPGAFIFAFSSYRGDTPIVLRVRPENASKAVFMGRGAPPICLGGDGLGGFAMAEDLVVYLDDVPCVGSLLRRFGPMPERAKDRVQLLGDGEIGKHRLTDLVLLRPRHQRAALHPVVLAVAAVAAARAALPGAWRRSRRREAQAAKKQKEQRAKKQLEDQRKEIERRERQNHPKARSSKPPAKRSGPETTRWGGVVKRPEPKTLPRKPNLPEAARRQPRREGTPTASSKPSTAPARPRSSSWGATAKGTGQMKGFMGPNKIHWKKAPPGDAEWSRGLCGGRGEREEDLVARTSRRRNHSTPPVGGTTTRGEPFTRRHSERAQRTAAWRATLDGILEARQLAPKAQPEEDRKEETTPPAGEGDESCSVVVCPITGLAYKMDVNRVNFQLRLEKTEAFLDRLHVPASLRHFREYKAFEGDPRGKNLELYNEAALQCSTAWVKEVTCWAVAEGGDPLREEVDVGWQECLNSDIMWEGQVIFSPPVHPDEPPEDPDVTAFTTHFAKHHPLLPGWSVSSKRGCDVGCMRLSPPRAKWGGSTSPHRSASYGRTPSPSPRVHGDPAYPLSLNPLQSLLHSPEFGGAALSEDR